MKTGRPWPSNQRFYGIAISSGISLILLSSPSFALTPKQAKQLRCINYTLRSDFKIFKNEDEAMHWLTNSFDPSWTGEEILALEYYSTGYSRSVNQYLRDIGKAPGVRQDEIEKINEIIRGMDSLLTKRVLNENITVFHARPDELAPLSWDTPIGAELSDPQYISTSLTPEFPTHWSRHLAQRDQKVPFMIEMHLPKGTHVTPADVRPISDQRRELELVLSRGSKFVVLGKKVNKDGVRILEVDLILVERASIARMSK